MAFAFTHIACNTVFAEAPTPAVLDSDIGWFDSPIIQPWEDSFIDQQPPWDIGATIEDSVVAEFSPEGTLIIRGRGKMMDFRIWTWKTMCEKKNKLSKVFIESGVTYIGDGAFSGCESLKAISVASDNKAYSSKDGVLYDKNFSALVKYPEGKSGIVTIPDGVTSIGYLAFGDCKNLTSIDIPSSVTSILIVMFSLCENLKAINIASDNRAYSSKDGVLYDKSFSKLIHYPLGKSGIVTIPDGVTSIGTEAFYKNKKLTSITIPNSVTSIDNFAFSNCENLSSITILGSEISIGYYAFSNRNLTSITILNTVPSSLSFDDISNGKTVFETVNKEICILYVPKGSVDAYRKANVWKDFKNIEPIE